MLCYVEPVLQTPNSVWQFYDQLLLLQTVLSFGILEWTCIDPPYTAVNYLLMLTKVRLDP